MTLDAVPILILISILLYVLLHEVHDLGRRVRRLEREQGPWREDQDVYRGEMEEERRLPVPNPPTDPSPEGGLM